MALLGLPPAIMIIDTGNKAPMERETPSSPPCSEKTDHFPSKGGFGGGEAIYYILSLYVVYFKCFEGCGFTELLEQNGNSNNSNHGKSNLILSC